MDKLTRLRLKRPLFKEMIGHLQTGYPLEACGLLGGRGGRVIKLYAIDNRLASPVAYEMDPHQQLNAMLDMEENELDLVAIFHSHPNGPETPSATDLVQAYYPDAAYLIVSFHRRSNPVARAFLIDDGRADEISLVIE